MEIIKELLKENYWFVLGLAFFSCGIIEAIKRCINRLVEVVVIENEKIRILIEKICKALFSLLPLPFGLHIGNLLFDVSNSKEPSVRAIFIYIMVGAIYIMYYFLFKTFIEKLQNMATRRKLK